MSTSMAKRRTMANQLKKAIRDSGMSINAIAIETEIPQPVLNRFVNSERDLTLTTADKLLRYFNLELTSRKGNAKKKKTNRPSNKV